MGLRGELLVKEVGEDFSGGHVGISVGIADHAGQIPAELAAGYGGVGFVIPQNCVVALAPLGIVGGHVVADQLVGLAVRIAVGVQRAELNAAAGLAGLAVRGRGVEEDHAAVLAGAQAHPHVAAHAEDVAGLEVLHAVGEKLAPALIGKGACHVAGAHDVAVMAAFGVHEVIDDPADIAGAVGAAEVVFIVAPPVVGMGGIFVIPVGVVGVMGLEEVHPGLGQADGGGLDGGTHVLPIPGAAVDVQRGAYGLHGGGQQVLQGEFAGGAVDRSGVFVCYEGEVDGGIGIAVDLDGLAHGELSGLGRSDLGSAGLSIDAVNGCALERNGFSVHGDGGLVGGSDFALDSFLGGLGLNDGVVLHGDVIDIAFLKLVLDGVGLVLGDGIDFFRAVYVETVRKAILVVAVGVGKILNSQIDSLYSRRLQGLWCAVICRCRNHDQ